MLLHVELSSCVHCKNPCHAPCTLRQRAPAGGSAGAAGGVAPRLGGEEALEAAIVLEILTNVLLTPEHLDLEALRYVMWVCKKLEVRGRRGPWEGWSRQGGEGGLMFYLSSVLLLARVAAAASHTEPVAPTPP